MRSGSLADGAHVRTGAGSYANVFLVNGNRIQLSGRTDLVVTKTGKQDVQLRLTTGKVSFTASNDHLTITLGQYEVQPKADSAGTVAALGDLADVRIAAGTVKLRDSEEKKTSKISAGAQRILKLDSSDPDSARPQISSAAPVPLPAMAPQTQAPTKKSKWPLILGIAGGAAAVGAIAATTDWGDEQGRAVLGMAMWVNNLFTPGSTGLFSLAVRNNGVKATSGRVTVTDTFPRELTPIQPTASEAPGWVCSVNAQTLTCTRSDALGARSTYPVITVRVIVAPDPHGTWTNVATVSGGGALGTGSSVPVFWVAPYLVLEKIPASPSFTRGSTGSFTLWVGNDSVSWATSGTVTVTDTFPAGLTPIQPTASEAPGWACSVNAQTLTCTRSDPLELNGNSQTPFYSPITVRADVALTAPASLTNTATVSGGGALNTAIHSVTVSTVAPSSLLLAQVTKEVDRPAVTVGDTIGFNLGVTNPSNAMPDDFAVHDTLPLGFQYRSDSAKIVITRPDGTAAAPAISLEPVVNSTELVFPVG
ncbi:MAG TPA: FecR domain-containing protein, partial [Candidatus Solibacter sp.]|nr:FecR domain-containing protein [Candidatus Solibacter sp.]